MKGDRRRWPERVKDQKLGLLLPYDGVLLYVAFTSTEKLIAAENQVVMNPANAVFGNGFEASLISGENPKRVQVLSNQGLSYAETSGSQSTFSLALIDRTRGGAAAMDLAVPNEAPIKLEVYDSAWTLIEEDSYRVVLRVLLNEQESLFCTLLFIEKDFKEVILPN